MGTPRLITSCQYHLYSRPKALSLTKQLPTPLTAKYLATTIQVLTLPLGSQPPSYSTSTLLHTPLGPPLLLFSMA
jgi:hypothetical protein